MKNLQPPMIFRAAFGILLSFAVQTSYGSQQNCSTGPFNFSGSSAWNTTNTGWSIDSSILRPLAGRYMALDFSDAGPSSAVSRHGVWSPPLCCPQNGTYRLSFRYSVAGAPSSSPCFLAVSILRDGFLQKIWRSPGGTLNWFPEISPPLQFSCCSPEFRLLFEGVKVEPERCGLVYDTVTFDDVSYIYVDDDKNRTPKCPADEPYPATDDDTEEELAPSVVIALIVSVAVVVIIIAALLFAALVVKRKRGHQLAEKDGYSVGYQTFVDEPSQRASTSDYEPMDSDGNRYTGVLPSGGNNSYNRLRMTGDAASEGQHVPSAHYDHFDLDTAYANLHQLNSSRDLQRITSAPDYSHI